jgi:aminodeoxyfutalosine deaminase
LYRKFSADYIFTGYQMLPENYALITTGEGVVVDITEAANAGDGIEKLSGIICPGFINAHCHLELSHMKGFIPEKTGLIDFVLKVTFERHFEEVAILTAIEAAEEEMLLNGIVAVGDICNNTLTLPQKSKGKLRYHNFIEASGFTPAVAESRFRGSVDFYNEYKALFPASSVVPHAPYSVSPELFRMIDEFPNNNILTIHNQETIAENELFKNRQGDFIRMYQKMNIDITSFNPTGKTSLQTYLPSLQQYQSLILVHNVYTTKEDIHFEQQQTSQIKNKKLKIKNIAHYCLCPNANLYITNTLPHVNLFIQQQCNIVLGTDSLASNHQLNMLEEIKTLQQHFPSIALETMLQWATINGARALQMDDELGSFEKGKKPGVVLIQQLNNFRLSALSTAKRIL